MSEDTTNEAPPQYEIDRVTDFTRVPLERLEDCLHEFVAFVKLMAATHALSEATEGAIKMTTTSFLWIDDGQREIRLTSRTVIPKRSAPESAPTVSIEETT